MRQGDGGCRTGIAFVAGTLVVLGAACGGGDGGLIETGRVGDETGALASVGPVPEPVTGASDVELIRCEWDRHGDEPGVLVDGVVTNNGDGPRILQGVPVTIRIDGDVVVDADDGEDLWNSATIGPGRQTLVRDTIDLGSGPAVGEPDCELGEPDLRPASYPYPIVAGEPLTSDDVELTGCDDDGTLRLRNPSDGPVGILAAVELFDEAGHSVGTMEIGQFPTTYTDGRQPGANEIALPPGEQGEYPVEIQARVAEWGTPHDGPVTSCEVVAAGYATDPEPVEVIVD